MNEYCYENPLNMKIVYIGYIHILIHKYIIKYFIAQLRPLTKIYTNTICNFAVKMDSYELFPF